MELSEYFNEAINQRGLNKSRHTEQEFQYTQSEYTKAKQRGNFILRQELNDYTPECSIKFVIIFNSILCTIFLICGIPIILSSENTVKTSTQYDTCKMKEINDPRTNKTLQKCEIQIFLNQTYTAPIHIYYRLNGFYSNYRQFVKSRVWSQLRGESSSSMFTYDNNCAGMEYNSDAFGNDTSKLISFSGEELKPNSLMNPCGNVALNFFNDNFTLYFYSNENMSLIFINETGIAYQADKKSMYIRSEDYQTTQWIDVENEHFMVWMNTETFSDFSKKWGRIDQDLQKGFYVLYVDNIWGISDGKTNGALKYFIISSAQGLGDASFFGWSLIKGALILSISVIIFSIIRANKKYSFDEKDLIWG